MAYASSKITSLVSAFTRTMQTKMLNRIDKRGLSWQEMSISELRNRIADELKELDELDVSSYKGMDEARDECVDIANQAMLLWDQLGSLRSAG